MDNHIEILKNSKVTPNDYDRMKVGALYAGTYFYTKLGSRVMNSVGFDRESSTYIGQPGIPFKRSSAVKELPSKLLSYGLEIDQEWNKILNAAIEVDRSNSLQSWFDRLDNTQTACGYAIVDAELRNEGFQGLIAENSFFLRF